MSPDALHIGTSGWHYDHWRGCFYPRELGKADWLSFYAKRFRCVEVNNSFYRLPSSATIRDWAGRTPSDFLFAVKASRLITHMRKLHDCAPVVDRFLRAMEAFGSKLGPVLFQLPPRWRANPERLAQFLRLLPRGRRFAMEFRDPSWHRDEIYTLLELHNVAFCIFDLAGHQSAEPVTADFVYLRLHGPDGAYQGSYAEQRLQDWAQKLRGWRTEGKDVYLFFDNDESGYAVQNATRLLEIVAG